MKKLRDLVDNEFIKNTKLNTLSTKVNNLEKKIENPLSTKVNNLKKKIENTLSTKVNNLEKKIHDATTLIYINNKTKEINQI